MAYASKVVVGKAAFSETLYPVISIMEFRPQILKTLHLS